MLYYILLLLTSLPLYSSTESSQSHTEDIHSQTDSAQALWDQEVDNLLNRAHIALKLGHYDQAENFYTLALNRKIEDQKRKSILIEMAHMYKKQNIYSKTCAVYEKFLELYPKDPEILPIYLKLGKLYNEMGSPEKAIERYYNILNLSLGAKPEKLKEIQSTTLEAQNQIAQTYFNIGKYEEARTFFERLAKLPFPTDKLEEIKFKIAKCAYYLKDFPQVLTLLQDFIYNYPKSSNIPEAHFLLANSYEELNQPENTILEVKNLIESTDSTQNPTLWIFWQKKTANQIANQFYQNGQYMNALKVYQAMLNLSKNANWQWPIIYQIGLCFEKLSMYPKAQEAYLVIIDPKKWEFKEPLNDYLSSIQDMAKWRKENLDWLINTELKINQIINQNV